VILKMDKKQERVFLISVETSTKENLLTGNFKDKENISMLLMVEQWREPLKREDLFMEKLFSKMDLYMKVITRMIR
jgi:hypothetical protein